MNRSIAMAVIISGLVWSTAVPNRAAAQTTTSGPAKTTVAATGNGPVPKAADGHPDLSGVWWRGADVGGAGFATGGGGAAAVPKQTFADLYQATAAAKAK